jgi:hypothetical protein
VDVLGVRLPHPLMVAPMGRHHPYPAAGAIFMMLTSSTVCMEDVAVERRSAPQWFQV